MSRAATIDSLFTDAPRKGRSSRCAICAGSEAPVRIQLTVARVTKSGKPRQGQMHSQSVRCCEQHAADLHARITEILPA